MADFSSPMDPFQEINPIRKLWNQTRRFQESNEIRMCKLEARMRETEIFAQNQQVSLLNLEKQLNQLAQPFEEEISIMSTILKECNINHPQACKFLSSSTLQDTNDTILVQDKEEERIHKAKDPTGEINQSIPFPERLRHDKERKSFESFVKFLSQVHVDLPILHLMATPSILNS